MVVKTEDLADSSSKMQSWVTTKLKSEGLHVDESLHEQFNFKELSLDPEEGSGQKKGLKIKLFNKDSYNGPRLEDFLKRLDAVYNTGLAAIDENEGLENKEARKIALKHFKEEAAKKLGRDCRINAIKSGKLLENEKEVLDKIGQASEHLQMFVAHALPLAYPQSTLKESLKEFQKKEAEWTAREGRPDFISRYKLGEATRVSAQRVVGDSIIPSTKRDEGKLANLVEVASGSVDSEGKINIEFTGYRHSSYSPIRVTDKIERRALATEAAQDMFAEIAKKELQGRNPDDFNEHNPLPISLSSMALLSPIKFDKKFMRDESEHRQLKESQYALIMYNQRPVKLLIDGKEIYVKPIVNLMNNPANIHGIKAKKTYEIINKIRTPLKLSVDLEERINTRGMYFFTKDVNTHLNNKIEDIKRSPLDKDAKEIIEGYEEIKASYDSSEGLKKAEEILANIGDNELITAYEELEKSQKAYMENKSPENKKNYFSRMKETRKVEKKLHEAYKGVEIERKKIWDENKKKLGSLDKKIIDYLGNEKNRNKINSEEGKPLKDLLLCLQLYHQGEAMYFGRNLEAHQFPSRYLLVNQMMGKPVDWFCKSGEDRTGRLNNFVEELCAFVDEKGHFPGYDFGKKDMVQKDRDTQQELAKTVVEFSVSRDICDANAHGARGLQQTATGMAVNKGLTNKTGNKIAHLAKGVYGLKPLEKVADTAQKEVDNFLGDIRVEELRRYLLGDIHEPSNDSITATRDENPSTKKAESIPVAAKPVEVEKNSNSGDNVTHEVSSALSPPTEKPGEIPLAESAAVTQTPIAEDNSSSEQTEKLIQDAKVELLQELTQKTKNYISNKSTPTAHKKVAKELEAILEAPNLDIQARIGNFYKKLDERYDPKNPKDTRTKLDFIKTDSCHNFFVGIAQVAIKIFSVIPGMEGRAADWKTMLNRENELAKTGPTDCMEANKKFKMVYKSFCSDNREGKLEEKLEENDSVQQSPD